jgi:hypothetical protein
VLYSFALGFLFYSVVEHLPFSIGKICFLVLWFAGQDVGQDDWVVIRAGEVSAPEIVIVVARSVRAFCLG